MAHGLLHPLGEQGNQAMFYPTTVAPGSKWHGGVGRTVWGNGPVSPREPRGMRLDGTVEQDPLNVNHLRKVSL